jgi:thiol:disulfide interchange protein DsbD
LSFEKVCETQSSSTESGIEMKSIFFFGLFLLAASSTWADESLQKHHIQVSWVAPIEFGPASSTLGIRFTPDPHWHIYWKNPGDSGAAPRFKIQVLGGKADPIQWPYPSRLPISHLVNFGYPGEVVFPFKIQLNSQAKSLQIEAHLEWLVCQEECIPGFGTLTLNRPVTSHEKWSTQDQTLLSRFLNLVPQPSSNSPWKIDEAQIFPQGLSVKLKPQNDNISPSAPDLFPTDGETVLANTPKREKTQDGYHFTFKTPATDTPAQETGFVLVQGQKSWEFKKIPLTPVNSRPDSAQNTGTQNTEPSILILFLFAFIGGALLNLMPCVLPVLSIKLLSLVKSHGGARGRVREALLYSAGVLVAFIALGATFLILRSAGSAIGWGFHLQSPLVVFLLILLFWALGLNFLGVFELGVGIMNWAGKSTSSSSFATGLLSVFVAAPCTGPFMGSALGASATLPPFQAMLLFLGLGLGLASPFLAIAAIPSLSHKIPKPGAWMERLKQFFAFPLFGTVLWLLWVLETQLGASGWLITAFLLLIISFALWLGKSKRKSHYTVAWFLGLFSTAWVLYQIPQLSQVANSASHSEWNSYSKEKVESARIQRQAVFIDFTAAWCITCQVNKKAVLETQAASDLFKNNQVLLIRADWTKQDPAITQALAEFGRNSVPLYVFYPSDHSTPKILPQILTFSDITRLFNPNQEKSR